MAKTAEDSEGRPAASPSRKKRAGRASRGARRARPHRAPAPRAASSNASQMPRAGPARGERHRAGRAAPTDAPQGKYVYCVIQSERAAAASARSASAPSRRRSTPSTTGHRRDRLGHADGRAGSDARERARAPARQRDGDAAAHRHPDVVRHGLQDRRRHHGAAAVGLRRVHRRAQQDAGQVRVRPQGAVGPRSDHPRDRGGGRGHPAAQEGDLVAEGLDLLRPHAVRPADRRRAPGALRALRRGDLRRRCATSRSPRARTSRSATG